MKGFPLRGLGFIIVSAAVMLLTSSCATLSSSGVGRVREYVAESDALPSAFDGCRIAFISDMHYPSLFTHRRLIRLVEHLRESAPDLLLLGGDYVTHNDSIDALFAALGSVETTYGCYAVLGNHERRNGDAIAVSMERHGVALLADETVRLQRDTSSIYLHGVRDSFVVDSLAVPDAPGGSFVLLLAHTPDYAERSCTDADIVLSGHTHGGQVSLFGLWTPVKNTVFGNRFLRGRNMTTSGSTVITTNGVGTSRRRVRFCVPSEIVLVTLRSKAH